MSYKHKWVNDWARWVCADDKGEVWEFEHQPLYEHGCWNCMTGQADRVISEIPPELTQRFTAQQIELEADGWTLWNFGDIHPAAGLFIEISTVGGVGESPRYSEFFHWLLDMSDDAIIAYRLSNADGYKDGVKVDCDCGKYMASTGGNHLTNCPLNRESYIDPDKPEWKAGELITGIPPLNVEIEFKNEDDELHDWEPVTILLIQGNRFWGKGFTQLINLDSCNYRPIQTERDKVIAKALYAITGNNKSTIADVGDVTQDVLNDLYDAGCLIDPDKGEE